MNIQFEGHFGIQEKNTGCVVFYDIMFPDILAASKYLSKIKPGPKYEGIVDGETLYFELKGYEPNKFTVEVRLIHKYASIPRRATSGSAGYDLTSTIDVVILPGERALIPIGISVKIPSGLYGRIAARSGLAINNGIQVGAGVIDNDYTGEIKVLLFNHDIAIPFKIIIGEKIAQLILERFETLIFTETVI